jgi:mRNA interferase RelE/StbE
LKVFLSTKAKRALDGSSPEMQSRLEAKIAELYDTPYPSGCKKLRGARNAYRLRVGDYRVLYTIVNREDILVFKISPRSSAYD